MKHRVGIVYVDMEVRRDDGPARSVRFLVDSGAALSVLPRAVWRSLGLEPRRSMRFTMADGTLIRRRISECRFTYEGIDVSSPVILGQRDDVALLGVLTLEIMGLVLHPFERRLRPARMMLASSGLGSL